METITRSLLDSYLGMHIRDICLNGFDGDEFNHCAHFVGHVLRIGSGKTCHRMVDRSHHKIDGASILVSDLFDITPDVHELLECPTSGQGLIFVSAPVNFQQIGSNIFRIKSIPKRHIGIFIGSTTWHYSNSRKQVVSQPTSNFMFHYPRQNNALWIGRIPGSARPAPFGVSVS